MIKTILLIVTVLSLVACQPPKKEQINGFKETMDERIGGILTSADVMVLKKDNMVSTEKINNDIIRYYIKMEDPHYIGGKGCEIYRDIDFKTNRITAWGYVSSPDKCRSKIKWWGAW
jgi:hypothetical protein